MGERSRQQARSWVLPDETAPVRLMNTIWADRAGVHDDLRTTSDLADWLVAIDATTAQHGSAVMTSPVRGGCAMRCDVLPRCAPTTPASLPRRRSRTSMSPSPRSTRSSPPAHQHPSWRSWTGGSSGDMVTVGPPVSRALTAVAVEAIELFTGADSPRLRACRAPGCVLYFRKDHPRRVCSTSCGNRARAARHYRRHRRDDREASN